MTTLPLVVSIVLATICVVLAATKWRLHHGLRVERARTEQLGAALRHVEAETARLERVRSDVVANISHEPQTPLASIKLLVETMEAGALDDPATGLTLTSPRRPSRRRPRRAVATMSGPIEGSSR
jgi:signal transduction histidine kinase